MLREVDRLRRKLQPEALSGPGEGPCPQPADLIGELARCASDVCYWLERYGWTFDPRLLPADPSIRFRPFPKQREFLYWLAERERLQEPGLVEKSRDWGITWLCVAHALHGWLFKFGDAVGFGSRKLELVDRLGDPDTIFEKIRFLLYRLPPWMLPGGFRRDEHDCHARLLNPATGASITGEGGDQIGRGGRKVIYFIDEASFLEHPQLIERSLLSTTNVRIDVSTPNGPGNPFAQKRHSGRVKVFTAHYSSDPRKTPEWVARKKAETDPVTWAQEYEIDYSASLDNIAIPAAWVRAAVGLELPASARVVAGLDIAEAGKNRTVLVARRGPVVLPHIVLGPSNTTATAHWAADECERLGVSVMAYDCVGVGLGVKGAYESSDRKLAFTPEAVNVGAAPSDTYWPDGRTSKERFLNLRAELWWKLRCRFERAFEFREHGVAHWPEDMISIPNDAQLIADLSLPLYFRTETGKIKLEAKADMARRGVRSPDRGDALALSLAVDDADDAFWTQPPQADRNGSLVARMPKDAWGVERRDEWDEPIEEREGESIFERMRREM
jgi:hypothetical protein